MVSLADIGPFIDKAHTHQVLLSECLYFENSSYITSGYKALVCNIRLPSIGVNCIQQYI